MRDAICVGALSTWLMLPGLAMAGDAVNPPVTFAKDLAPILQEKCQECHRSPHSQVRRARFAERRRTGSP